MPRAVLLALVLAACAHEHPPAPTGTARTVPFRCEQALAFTARFDPGTALLHLGPRDVRLREVDADEGRRFEGEGVTLWRQGDRARLTLEEADYACMLDREALG